MAFLIQRRAARDGDSDISYINEYISCMSHKSANFKEYDIYSFGSIVFSFFSEEGLSDQNFDSTNRKDALSFLEGFHKRNRDMPPQVRQIVMACWKEDFQKRPLFEEICWRFIEYFKQVEELN